MSDDGLRTLRGELELDLERLDALEAKYRLVKDKLARIEPDEFDLVALAHAITNLYGIMENSFTRIAKHFENQVDPATWHKDLIMRMMIRVPGVRPAVLTTDQAQLIDQLRSFRHAFRHIYLHDLDPVRLALVDSRTPSAVAAFRSAYEGFATALDSMIAALDAAPEE